TSSFGQLLARDAGAGRARNSASPSRSRERLSPPCAWDIIWHATFRVVFPSRFCMPAAITLSMPEPDVALLTIDLPDRGANVLLTSVMTELSGHLDALEKRSDLAGLIVASAKQGIFVAGADLREFAAALSGDLKPQWTTQLCLRGQGLFRRL